MANTRLHRTATRQERRRQDVACLERQFRGQFVAVAGQAIDPDRVQLRIDCPVFFDAEVSFTLELAGIIASPSGTSSLCR